MKKMTLRQLNEGVDFDILPDFEVIDGKKVIVL